jgi:uncharacterized glyoxalase superfamily protein PhnB
MKIKKMNPNLAVADVRRTVLFYAEHFGFELVMAVPESQDGVEQTLAEGKAYAYALMAHGGVELAFQQVASFAHDVPLATGLPVAASVSFYFEVTDIEEFHAKTKRALASTTDLKLAWYGMREFYVPDNNGYILGFAEPAR